MTLKLKTSSSSSTTQESASLKLQRRSFCCHNRSGLLIFSLCIIILLTQQAVVSSLYLPPLSSTSSLVMISPQVNNPALAAVFALPETIATNVLTPGQRVINSVPAEDRGTFIMYQLANALKTTDTAQAQPRWLSNLDDIIQNVEQTTTKQKNVPVYGNFATDLLHWLMEKFNLTHQDVYNNLMSRSELLCTSDGVCYNSADVGNFCCPF